MLKVTSVLIGLALIIPACASAGQMEHRHEGYRHALQELRFARALLERPEGWGRVAEDQQRASGEIDRAIEEMRHAIREEGGNPNEHPPIDMHWEPRDRLRRAMEALGRAREAIRGEGADEAAQRALRHIDEAQRALRHATEHWG